MQIRDFHLTKTGRVWNQDTQGPWVSKTDVVEFELCGHRCFLAHQLDKRYEEFRTPSALQSLLSGQTHELSMDSEIGISVTYDVEKARTTDGLYKVPIRFYNHDYGMVGVLDGIWFNGNILFPVEIKAHNRFRALDRIELAFYWRLLEPLQPIDVSKEDRKGYVFLGQSKEPREVLFRRRDLRESERKVQEVRDAKIKDPGFSLSKACRSCVLEEEHKAESKNQLSLDLIYDLGPKRKKIFNALGIYTVSDLAQADPSDLMNRWSVIAEYDLSVQRLTGMQAHARSWLSEEPEILDGSQISSPSESIILDLEYCTLGGQYIFLVGMLVVDKDEQVSIKQEFATNPEDESRILEYMTSVLTAHPTYQIVTWSGLSADFPMIEDAWERHGLAKFALDDFRRRHVDLFQCSVRGVRLPAPGLGLKAVSDYFNFKRRLPDISGGLDAVAMYIAYLSSKDDRLRNKLIAYNGDDLDATLFVWKKLRELSEHAPILATKD